MHHSISRRAQTTLPSVAVALVVLTVVTAIGIAMADSAITGAERTPDERRVAAATADQLVTADGPLGERANVLNSSLIATFDSARLQEITQSASAYDIDVRLDGTTVAASGNPTDGATIHRLVLVEETTEESLEPDGTAVTIPQRADSATITLTPPDGASVWTVRANDRVLLHNESGLRGTFEVELVPYETTELRFQTAGSLSDDTVRVEYETPQTTKATLTVTVDA